MEGQYGDGANKDDAPQKPLWYSGKSKEEPKTILGLLLQTVTHPGYIGELGVTGVSGHGMLMQLQVLFGVCVLMAAVPQAMSKGYEAVSGEALQWAVVRTTWVMAFAVVLMLPAKLTHTGATFLGLLSGLAIIEILLSIGMTAMFAALYLMGYMVDSSTPTELYPYAHFLARMIGYGALVGGVFEIGCGAGTMAAFIMNIMAWLLTPVILMMFFGTGG